MRSNREWARASSTFACRALCGGMALVAAGCATLPEDGGVEWGWDGDDASAVASGVDIWSRLQSQLARRDPQAAREFLGRTLAALHGDDVERLAQVGDMVRWVSERAAWLPGVSEYAGWLESRQEYFEAAKQVSAEARREVERATQRAAPEVALPGARFPSPPIALPAPVSTALSKAPVPVAVRGMARGVRRERVDTGRAYWRERVGRRAAPSRAAELLPVMQAAFRAEGVPEELVWMAEVESSMKPSARSPVGAVGLFQLMPKTAESNGLALKPQDQRLDPAASAGAAARYLRLLHGRFDSWPLALAAYNAGQSRVASLCRKRGRSFDAILDGLPLETRLYVPRVLETVRARTGVDPETLPAPKAQGKRTASGVGYSIDGRAGLQYDGSHLGGVVPCRSVV